MSGATSDLHYNHDCSDVFFDGEWITVWNGNQNRYEAQPGQLNYMAKSSDRVKWSAPMIAFSGPAAANPVFCNATCMQWQPNLVLLAGGTLLGCAWSQGHHGTDAEQTFWSVLDRSPQLGGRWTNRQLLFDGRPNKHIGGVRWMVYPTQNPVVLRSGRLLVPVTMEASNPMQRLAAALISDDEGKTFVLGNGTGQVGGWQSQWETTVWEPTHSANSTLVLMFDRNNSGAAALPPDQRMLYAKSTDAGYSFTKLQAVRAETVVSRMMVTSLVGDLFMLVQNDWKTAVNRQNDRVNAAMWFNRGGGINFVQGPGFAVGNPTSFYPQTFVDRQSNEASICFTGNGGIHLSRVRPLPDPRRRYVWPRTNIPSLFTAAPSIENNVLVFHNEADLIRSKQNASLTERFSLAMWVEPDCPSSQICMLADTRNGSAAPLLGLLPSNDSSTMQPYFYPAPGSNGSPGGPDNLASGLQVELRQWSFIGVSVSCNRIGLAIKNQCTAQFFVNGKASSIMSFPRLSDGFAAAAQLKLSRFVGSYRALAAFPEAVLTLAEHNTWANQYVGSLSLPELSPAAAQYPEPRLQLDPATTNTLSMWQSNAVPATDIVRAVKTESNSGLLLCGQGSAGVDIPFLSGATREILHARLRFRLVSYPNYISADPGVVDLSIQRRAPGAITARDTVVIVTIGDSRHHARIAVVDKRLVAFVSTDMNKTQPLLGGQVSVGTWHVAIISIVPTTGRMSVSVDGAEVVTLDMLPLQSIWMYAGDGYRTLNTTAFRPTACAEIDLTAMDTVVSSGEADDAGSS